MTVYANVGHILLKRGNTVQSTAYKGPLGELTLDTDLHTVRVHDGKTFGGNVILASNTEVWALSNSISTITGLDAGFISNINTLLSNAATQATSLTTLTANAAAQATDITNLWSNAATQSSAITTLQGQVGQTYGNANVAAYLAVGLNTANTSSNTNTLATTAFVQNILPTGGIIMWSGASTAIPYGWHLCDGTNSTPDLRGQFVIGAGGTYAVSATGGSANAIVVSHSHSVTDAGHNHTVDSFTGIHDTAPYGSGALYTAGANPGPIIGSLSPNTNVAVTGVTINSTGSNGTGANLPPYYALCYIMKVI